MHCTDIDLPSDLDQVHQSKVRHTLLYVQLQLIQLGVFLIEYLLLILEDTPVNHSVTIMWDYFMILTKINLSLVGYVQSPKQPTHIQNWQPRQSILLNVFLHYSLIFQFKMIEKRYPDYSSRTFIRVRFKELINRFLL